MLLADTTPAVAGVGWTANDRNQSHTHQEAGSWMDNDGRIAVVDGNEMNWLVLNQRGKYADLWSARRCGCKVEMRPKWGMTKAPRWDAPYSFSSVCTGFSCSRSDAMRMRCNALRY